MGSKGTKNGLVIPIEIVATGSAASVTAELNKTAKALTNAVKQTKELAIANATINAGNLSKVASGVEDIGSSAKKAETQVNALTTKLNSVKESVLEKFEVASTDDFKSAFEAKKYVSIKKTYDSIEKEVNKVKETGNFKTFERLIKDNGNDVVAAYEKAEPEIKKVAEKYLVLLSQQNDYKNIIKNSPKSSIKEFFGSLGKEQTSELLESFEIVEARVDKYINNINKLAQAKKEAEQKLVNTATEVVKESTAKAKASTSSPAQPVAQTQTKGTTQAASSVVNTGAVAVGIDNISSSIKSLDVIIGKSQLKAYFEGLIGVTGTVSTNVSDMAENIDKISQVDASKLKEGVKVEEKIEATGEKPEGVSLKDIGDIPDDAVDKITEIYNVTKNLINELPELSTALGKGFDPSPIAGYLTTVEKLIERLGVLIKLQGVKSIVPKTTKDKFNSLSKGIANDLNESRKAEKAREKIKQDYIAKNTALYGEDWQYVEGHLRASDDPAYKRQDRIKNNAQRRANTKIKKRDALVEANPELEFDRTVQNTYDKEENAARTHENAIAVIQAEGESNRLKSLRTYEANVEAEKEKARQAEEKAEAKRVAEEEKAEASRLKKEQEEKEKALTTGSDKNASAIEKDYKLKADLSKIEGNIDVEHGGIKQNKEVYSAYPEWIKKNQEIEKNNKEVEKAVKALQEGADYEVFDANLSKIKNAAQNGNELLAVTEDYRDKNTSEAYENNLREQIQQRIKLTEEVKKAEIELKNAEVKLDVNNGGVPLSSEQHTDDFSYNEEYGNNSSYIEAYNNLVEKKAELEKLNAKEKEFTQALEDTGLTEEYDKAVQESNERMSTLSSISSQSNEEVIREALLKNIQDKIATYEEVEQAQQKLEEIGAKLTAKNVDLSDKELLEKLLNDTSYVEQLNKLKEAKKKREELEKTEQDFLASIKNHGLEKEWEEAQSNSSEHMSTLSSAGSVGNKDTVENSLLKKAEERIKAYEEYYKARSKLVELSSKLEAKNGGTALTEKDKLNDTEYLEAYNKFKDAKQTYLDFEKTENNFISYLEHNGFFKALQKYSENRKKAITQGTESVKAAIEEGKRLVEEAFQSNLSKNLASGDKYLNDYSSQINNAERYQAALEGVRKSKKAYEEVESGDGYVIANITEQSGAIAKVRYEWDAANKSVKAYTLSTEKGTTAYSWKDALKDTGTSITKIVSQAFTLSRVFGQVDNLFRTGKEAVLEYNKALTNISYTMDLSSDQLNDLGEATVQMARDLNTSVSDALSISQIYSNMQSTPEEIVTTGKPTAILANLAGETADTAANQIQSVMQQFKMSEDEAMHIADVYDKISANIKMDYAKGIEVIAAGTEAAGQTAAEAGLSFEQLSSIVAKMAEMTREDGSSIGNALKTIMVRTSKASTMSDEVDNDTLSKASAALNQIGIKVYELDGTYRSFDTIMGELADKWDTLTDAQRANLSYNIAATRLTWFVSAHGNMCIRTYLIAGNALELHTTIDGKTSL